MDAKAPTTSTTAALAVGDALAVAVSDLSGMAPDDFRKYHPGGKLGARLLTAAQLMRSGEALPIVAPECIAAEQPDFVLLLPWNLETEILAQEQEFRDRGGKFIIPIPTPKVV